MKYIAYCRKSRDEADRQVLSIEAQTTELKEFAKQKNLDILEFVEEAKTAKIPGREKFEYVLQKIEKGEAQGILAWHPDRLARNSMDGGRIIYLLDTGKLLDLKFPTHWFEDTPQGKFTLSIAFGQSKYYIDSLSENVRRGLRQKIRNGVWPAKAYLGYVNNPKTRGIDVGDNAKVIIHAFELFAKGNKTFTDISNYLFQFGITRKSGKPRHINQIREMLGNKFYIGILKYGGEYHRGTHKPIISQGLFERVQRELQRRTKHFKKTFRFPYLGLIRCSGCGAAITAETHTKYYKGTDRYATYTYYRCTRKLGPCTQPPIPTDDLEELLHQKLLDVALPQTWADQWLEWVDRDETEEKKSLEKTKQVLETEIGELERKLGLLLEGYLDKVIDQGAYIEKKNEIFDRKLKLQEEIAKIDQNRITWLELLREFIKTASGLEKIAAAKKNEEEISSSVKEVGSNFFLEGRQLRASYNLGFDKLWLVGGSQNLAGESAAGSRSVGETGVAPATSRTPCARSTAELLPDKTNYILPRLVSV